MDEQNDYAHAVQEAATAVQIGEAANWKLAQLTYENTRTGAGRKEQPGKVPMAQWCKDVQAHSGRRFSVRTGKLYKAAWEWRMNSADSAQFPSFMEVLAEISPSTHGEKPAAKLKRATPVPPPNSPRAALARERATTAISRLDPAGKTAIFDQLLTDRDVDTEVSRQQIDRKARQDRLRKEHIENDPLRRTLDALEGMNTLERYLDRFIRDAATVLPRIDPDTYRAKAQSGDKGGSIYFLRSRCAGVRRVIEQIEGWLETGVVGGDIDAFFQRVLAESRGDTSDGETAA